MNPQKYVSAVRHLFWIALAILLVLVMVSIRPVIADNVLSKKNNQTGFLVLTADRGFVGNEEINDAFDIFTKERNASLIFVTDERTQKYLKAGLDMLLHKGAERIVIIPLFISAATPRYQLAHKLLEREKLTVPISYAHPYGKSFFAVEDLADKFRTIHHPADTTVLVVGYGATDDDSEQKMQADWKRIAEKAATGFDFASLQTLVAYEEKGEDAQQRTAELKQALANTHGAQKRADSKAKTIIVPFHFGSKHDNMMSFDARLKRLLPSGVQLLADGNSDTNSLLTWLQREANRSQQLAAEDVGVVFLSHGADFNWNETMREAVQPLMKYYKIEFVFSMADQSTIQRAIRKLEQRGARAAVIVRAFALEESFRNDIERMVGLDVEGEAQDVADHPVHAGHGHGHGHHGAAASPPARIRTALPIQTVGGLGSSPLFAAALLDRARALSGNPARETVILVAHGSGSDHQNEQWRKTLETIADHMRKAGGSDFQAIKVATWREDWLDKRAPSIEEIRAMIEDAKKQGGRAIVIPARITGQGFEKKFLAGLDYDLGSGFAPHPLFVRWVEEQIKAGIAQLNRH